MNIGKPWNIFFFVALVAFFWIRHVFIERTRHEKKAVRRVDLLERMLLIGMVPGTLLLPLLYLFTPFLTFADYWLPAPVLWLGAVTLVASLWLFWRSHRDLGQNWSVTLELRENHELVTRGVYRFVRHPMYASIWLGAFGQGMLLQNWLAGWSVDYYMCCLYYLTRPREQLQKMTNGEVPLGEVCLESDPPRMFKAVRATRKRVSSTKSSRLAAKWTAPRN